MNRSAQSHLLWIVAAGVVGFLSAFVFGDLLRLPRSLFLVPHLLVTFAFLFAYARWSETNLRKFWSRRLGLGVLGASLVSVFLVLNVLGQQASPRQNGPTLWIDLLWLGVVYGAADALLLSALPVIATWRASARMGWTVRWPGRLGAAILGIVASAFVTAAYHLGYPEFRGPAVGKAVAGNAIMSVAQIVTASPIAAAGSHIAMHVAAVLHGPETTVQLPPHESFYAAK